MSNECDLELRFEVKYLGLAATSATGRFMRCILDNQCEA